MKWIFDNIVQYLEDGNWNGAADMMGVICHFAGDATCPLHATWNYDPGGHHSDYEDAANTHVNSGEISIPDNYVPQYLDNITNAALVTLKDSFSFTKEGSGGGVNLTDYLLSGIYWNDWIKSMTENRLRAAVQLTANVWYTAMIQAGALPLISPENGVYLLDNTPTFAWTSVTDPSGVTCQLQIDDNADFSSPVYFAMNLTENTRTLPDENALALGKYYWRVRVVDGVGNASDWSSVWTFFVRTQTSWAQTDWKGGPTKPSLQAGTWAPSYDNFYDNYKVDWSQAGEVKLKSFSGSQPVAENVTPPGADSYVLASSSGSNYGTSSSIYVGRYNNGAERGYLKFDLSSIPSNKMISQAKLWVYSYSASGGGAKVKVERVDDDSWTESGITWSNQPARTALLVGPQSVSSGSIWYSWTSSTLTSFVAAQYAGDKIVSIALIDNGENSGGSSNHYARFDSKEYSSGAYASKLEVTYPNNVYENGWFESSVFDAGKTVDWKTISWSESKPTGTSIVVKARTVGANENSWSDWYTHGNNTENTSMPDGRCVQYRVELSTSDNTKTPELFDIMINHEAGVTPFTLDLKAGWNMISFPVMPDNKDPDSIFPGDYTMFRWDAVNKLYVLCTDENIENGVGYCVYVLAAENVVVSGTPVDSLALPLSAGWNLIGVPLGGASIASPDDTPDGSVLPYAFTWDAENRRYTPPVTDLVAGAGYWVYAMNSCVLRLPGGV
jgi:hypothetical protein